MKDTSEQTLINLRFAQKLILETTLPIQDVMTSCDYHDLDHFNAAYKKCFRKLPLETKRKPLSENSIMLSVPYIRPYDFDWMLKSYENHKIGNLEWFEMDKMFRVVTFGTSSGIITIENDEPRSQLLLSINFSDVRHYKEIFNRTKRLFDTDCNPNEILKVLETNKEIKKIYDKYPGLRIANGWEPFEIAIATILGQLVSVERGRTLLNDLIELLGTPTSIQHENKIVKKFPTAKAIAEADLSTLKTTRIRKKTLVEFSKAYSNKKVHFNLDQSLESFKEKMLAVSGIGPWTANYVGLKALKHSDAFPDTDLLLARAVELFPKGTFDQLTPFRGYVAILLWREFAVALSKKNKKN